MKRLLLIILLIGFAIPSLLAQDNQPLLIQYKDGTQMVIDLPSSSKVVEKDNLILTTPYGYNLRLQPHKITKKHFVNSQFVADSLTSKTIRVTCEPTKVTLTNPNNKGYTYLYDANFHQIKHFDNNTLTADFDPSSQKSGSYWLSSSNALIGIDSSK